MSFIDEVKRRAAEGQEQRRAFADRALKSAIIESAKDGRKQIALREVEIRDRSAHQFIFEAAQELVEQGGFRLTEVRIPDKLESIWIRLLFGGLSSKPKPDYVYYVLEWD
jgi:hypothetical protein